MHASTKKHTIKRNISSYFEKSSFENKSIREDPLTHLKNTIKKCMNIFNYKYFLPKICFVYAN